MAKNDELRYGAPGETAVHLCVDMQRMFAEDTEWKMPWLERVLPNILSITSTHPERTIFTRFIPAQKPGQGVGMWRHYYERWGSMTIDQLGPEMIGLVPELAKFVPPARILRQARLLPLDGQRPAPAAAQRRDRYRHHHRRRNRRLRARHHAGRDRLGLPRHPRDRCSLQLGGRNPRRHDECLHEPVRRAGRNRHDGNPA